MIEVYADGSCNSKNVGGWAYMYRYRDKTYSKSACIPNATNNQMELFAVLMALRSIKRNGFVRHRIVVHTDSAFVVDSFNNHLSRWETNGWLKTDNSPVKLTDLWQEIGVLRKKLDVKLKWVRGHVGIPGNEVVDHMARTASQIGYLKAMLA